MPRAGFTARNGGFVIETICSNQPASSAEYRIRITSETIRQTVVSTQKKKQSLHSTLRPGEYHWHGHDPDSQQDDDHFPCPIKKRTQPCQNQNPSGSGNP